MLFLTLALIGMIAFLIFALWLSLTNTATKA